MNAIDVLEGQHRKVLAILKKIEDGGGDALRLIRELADDLRAQMAQMATDARPPIADGLAAERDHDGGYSKSHGYGEAHGGPTGPDDAPATPIPSRPTSR
jgi:hypothetical protein